MVTMAMIQYLVTVDDTTNTTVRVQRMGPNGELVDVPLSETVPTTTSLQIPGTSGVVLNIYVGGATAPVAPVTPLTGPPVRPHAGAPEYPEATVPTRPHAGVTEIPDKALAARPHSGAPEYPGAVDRPSAGTAGAARKGRPKKST